MSGDMTYFMALNDTIFEKRLDEGGVAGEHAVAEAAVETPARGAVVVVELNQSLARKCVVCFDSEVGKSADDRVVFRSGGFENIDSAVCQSPVVVHLAAQIDERSDDVDN